MKEFEQKHPSLRPSDKPIYFSYGRHSLRNIENLSHFTTAIERHLVSSSTGKVVVWIENACCSTERSELVQEAVDQGTLPSIAFLNSWFFFTKGRTPKIKELKRLERRLNKYPNKYPDAAFLLREMKALDKLSIAYPKRISLIMEKAPSMILTVEEAMVKKAQRSLLESNRLIMHGKFNQALPYFKAGVEILSGNDLKREERILYYTREYTKKEDIIAIVGRLGSLHTKISHELRRLKYNIEYGIDFYNEKGHYFYDPLGILLRIRTLKPYKHLSELEWIQGVIGDTIEQIFGPLESSSNEKEMQAFIKDILTLLQTKLSNFDQVKEFEQLVRRRGFITACRIL